MKKCLFFLGTLLVVAQMNSVHAGQVVYKTGYVERTVVQGEGLTINAAELDAKSAIPLGYVVDHRNSPILECTKNNDLLRATDGESCDTSIPENRYRITYALVSKVD